MKKILVFLFLILSVGLSAQDEKHCYTTEIYNQLIQEHPEVLQVQSALEVFTAQYSAQHSSEKRSGTVLIIPIVFHIIHNYGAENISEAQVYDQVRILNEDFRKLSYDTASIVSVFKPIASDCEIEFRLANIDPNGNCTNGIDRIQSTLTYNADDNSKLNPWPSNQYLNIWVVSDLGNSGAAAYAYYPGTAPAGKDGVISIHGYIGSIGTGSLGRSRVLTHEIGHCLNLAHVWGSTNNPGVACGDDGVNDTPITKGWVACNLNGSLCNPPSLENVQNYMEYSYCCNMFTEGQKNRMRAALNSTAGDRNNLWQQANLIATGTNGTTASLCAPVSDFSVNRVFLCEGDTLQYRDLSWQGQPATWSWTFPGGTPSSSTDSIPSVAYNTPGIYDATLTVSNATGNDTKTRTSYITVVGSGSQPAPFSEGFENSFPGTNAAVLNYDNGNTWQQVNNAAATGTHSIKINNFSSNSDGAIDEYITSPIDFTGLEASTLSFKVAYSQRTDTSRHDGLKVYYSLNCGETWVLRYTKSGASLATVAPHSSAYTPSGAGDWRQDAVSVAILGGKPNVRLKFQAISARGNNLYLDDINLFGSPVGIEENNGALASFDISPVPATSQLNINFELQKLAHVSMDIYDLPGKKVMTVANEIFHSGMQDIHVANQLPDGIYFLRVNADDAIMTKKFVVMR
ncbi:MAG: M43 family zinc metalloprotease [Bacteroidetes bacterium]|nr:M43 family zinc metalloprotease [Bacteroidota bacterium]